MKAVLTPLALLSVLPAALSRQIFIKLKNDNPLTRTSSDGTGPAERLARSVSSLRIVPLIEAPKPKMGYSVDAELLEEYEVKKKYNLDLYAHVEVPEEEVAAVLDTLNAREDVAYAEAELDVVSVRDLKAAKRGKHLKGTGTAVANESEGKSTEEKLEVEEGHEKTIWDFSKCDRSNAVACQAYLYKYAPMKPWKVGGHNVISLHSKYPYKGKYARVWSMESGHYMFHHEDLPLPWMWTWNKEGFYVDSHDTGSAGTIIGKDNGFGVLGIAAGARMNYIRFGAKAFLTLAEIALPGDSMHVGVSYLKYLEDGRAEWTPIDVNEATSDSIKYLVNEKQVNVIIAAGNGGADLKDDTTRPLTMETDNGSIYAGSVSPITGARAQHSNYGDRVSVFSWGDMVTSTHCMPDGKCTTTDMYTHTFSGTSSANPIIAGLTTLIQSIAFGEGYGVIHPSLMREALINTGRRIPIPSREKYTEVIPDADSAVQYIFSRMEKSKEKIAKIPSLDQVQQVQCKNWGVTDDMVPADECNRVCRDRCGESKDIVNCMVQLMGDLCVHVSGAGGNFGIGNPAHLGRLGDDRTLNYNHGGHCVLSPADDYIGNFPEDGDRIHGSVAEGCKVADLCSGIPEWDADKIYDTWDELVALDGTKYRQNYYNQNMRPDLHSGPWGQPWKSGELCL